MNEENKQFETVTDSEVITACTGRVTHFVDKAILTVVF